MWLADQRARLRHQRSLYPLSTSGADGALVNRRGLRHGGRCYHQRRGWRGSWSGRFLAALQDPDLLHDKQPHPPPPLLARKHPPMAVSSVILGGGHCRLYKVVVLRLSATQLYPVSTVLVSITGTGEVNLFIILFGFFVLIS
ncbi:hypothetical protein ZEAMMB73_Zm00001d006861 [Zea mays]|jgi:hypothetical protein|uniref:Uncharacterized protein n=2 Tax=Zea mays TaxID=4577 RepID=A0A1D6F1E5_MAIZE|nr:hypothetical protein ZEAMMB73_Zm00001d006861 [Zea mays]ONM25297.1 hypothetical protein ZEAMMB73_Zm00001d006861 [Zea mays]ONM25302.1 hypothetical protein ZEAMMB73_Zm00001d006861 [Zea mays]